MLNRKFTKTEKILLLILAVLLLAVTYYRLVYQPVRERIAAASIVPLEEELVQQQAKARQIKNMQQEMDEARQEGIGVVASYDNFKEEANALNQIFAAADTFSFNFKQPEAVEDAVRREIDISFTAADYQVARSILQELHDCSYRCLIKDVELAAVGNRNTNQAAMDPNVTNSQISCTLTVTFYETLYDAKTTEGLKVQETTAAAAVGLGNADLSGVERSDLETAAESVAASIADKQS